MWNSISYKVKKAGESAFNNLPIGIMVLNEENYDILWSNKSCKEIFKSELESLNLNNVNEELLKNLKLKKERFEITIYGSIYRIEYSLKHSIVYLTNIDELESLKRSYNDRTIAFGYISIDNFEQALSHLDVQDKAEYNGKIIGRITEFFENYGAYTRAITTSKFVCIMNKASVLDIIESKLPILDEIKSMTFNNVPLRISLSIGLSCMDKGILEVSERGNELMDYALNRGGDQAIIEVDGEKYSFGAKEENVIMDEKVDIRVKSQELHYLMNNSSNVFIMPHRLTDTDGFGSSLLVLKMAESLNKKAYIILEEVDSTVKKILSNVETNYISLSEKIINVKKASALIDSNSLLVVVDFQGLNQSPDSFEVEEVESSSNERLLRKAKHIAIVDHHRKGADAIQNSDFYYSKTSSSSSVEILMQLYEFWPNKFEISEVEATWMLLGIIVDTNNYLYRVNVKTFEISSELKQYGADLTEVQRYLKEMPNELKRRLDFLNNITYIRKFIAISKATDDTLYERADLAKISDELMDLENVELGVTIGRLDKETVGVSARSLGKINAQTIMERLGGGGHFTSAACQIKDSTIDEVYEKLIDVINSFYEEDNKSKVIFLKDVKGFGDRYEIKNINFEDCEKFLKDNLVILATQENIKMIDEEINKDQLKIEEENRKANILKDKIIEKPLTIKAELINGTLRYPIYDKDIRRLVLRELNINLNNKQIILLEPIRKIGTYNIKISLTKDVECSLELYVIQK